MQGSGPLWDELHALLETGAQPTPIHRFFASLPPLLRERGAPHQLIVTTSYDLALEQALLDAGEEFDVVSYIASGRHRGRFCHLAPDGTAAPIEIPNTYATELSLERRTIILKLHGRFDPSPQREWESFVVTEDDYIEYLAQSDVSTSVPVGLAAQAPAQPLPLPRLHDGRLEPARRAQAALGRPPAQLPLVGGAAGREAARARVLAPPRRRRARGAARRVRRAARPPRRRDGARMNEVAVPASPYKGLAPFGDSELDALLFFGRERDSEIVVANLLAARLTVLYGASGVGKSSLLGACVARRLRQEPDAEVIVFSSWSGDAVGAACAPRRRRPTAGREVYLILDQFEEYFLYHADDDGRGDAADELPELLAPHRPPRERADLGARGRARRLDAFKARIPNVLANYLRLPHLDRAAGRAAIIGPLERWSELAGDGRARRDRAGARRRGARRDGAGRVELGGVGTASSARPWTARGADRGADPPARDGAALAGGARSRARASLRLETFPELGGAEAIVRDHLERALGALAPGATRTSPPRSSTTSSRRPARRSRCARAISPTTRA